jgi:6-phosphofructokinase
VSRFRVCPASGWITLQVLLDTRAKVNIIREAFAHKAGLAIQSLPRSIRNERLQAANGTLEPFVGLIETEVTIGNITIRTPLLVTKHYINDYILGEPFACRSTMVAQHTPSGRCLITILSEDGTRTITVQAVASIGKAIDNDLEDEDIYIGKEVMV